MKYSELQAELQNLTNTNISVSKIANVLGVTRQNMDFRVKKGKGDIPSDEIKLLEKAFNVSLLEETITVDHIHINPSCGCGTAVLDDAEITPIKLGTQLLQSVMKISHPQNLKTFKACGDSMETIIEDGDMLLVDTGRTDFNNGGIFLLTINNDWFVKRLRKRLSGELEVISDNTKYQIETFKPNDDIEIVIKGRVIKNLSRGL